MTLPDKEEIIMPDKKQRKLERTVGTCLHKVLVKAKNDGRLVCGVFECASHMQAGPDVAMMCILPETATSQFSTSFQHKLIEAYCLEHDIPLIKIKNCDKLNSLLNESSDQKTENHNPLTTPSVDTSCVLIDWPPKTRTNKYEHRLMDLIWTNQVVQLPI